ncbi:class I SAM-dependent methyltransferase [Nocardioides sp. SOB77]|uniref:Class I SAM-dependent methyltransferase n=1 Tax=Nocardioides oceani TaxID=3058369 RepID=A0ABT8FKC1_9ACTN|nr:class I SAM-dependent methyltransferase [Nocardioides oceani]MDN4174971.1 class I SAM-dependent methyltransferase [Nocardioides oceani]
MVDDAGTGGRPRVDDAGLHLPDGFEGSGDVLFDGHHAWSFTAEPGSPFVPWPKRMTRWLDGVSQVRVVSGGVEVYAGEVAFGSGEGRVRFVDKDGIPVMIDKWGLLQRPFSGRDGRVVEQMVEMTERILDVMEAECGVQGWIAFGTLLGAAREGAVIGHDSDVDLAYLSEKATPAEMAVELWDIARALRRHGMRVLNKSAAFITVVFTSPDGGMSSIDLYTCFYVGDLLHETATVRQEVPRSAILPLGELSFEGRMLPAPADPDTMLTVSYGAGWRVPDPSFRHEPGPEVTDRFDGWFSSLMRQRRDWERYLADLAQEDDQGPSEAAGWVADRLAATVPDGGDLADVRVVELGAGNGQDALHLAGRGIRVLALDYARQSLRAPARRARRDDLPADFDHLNLYDLRDVLTRGALVARDRARQVLYARDLLETLEPDGLDNFWRFASMTLRAGGSAYLEGQALSRADAAEQRAERGGGRLHPVDPRVLEGRAVRAGGRVVHREGFLDAAAAVSGGAPARWRMIVEWPTREDQ